MFSPTLTKLDLTNNLLSTGKGLESFSRLQTLILDKNSLKSLSEFPQLKSVDTLWLNNNLFSDLKSLMDEIEKKFPNVTYLSMMKNPACPNMYFSDGEAEAYQRYRYYVIFRLKKLKYLDATPIDNSEQKEAERVGKFSITAKPVVKEGEPEIDLTQAKGPTQSYKPNKPPKVATFLGKGKARYDGTNSEGNRFISNDDL